MSGQGRAPSCAEDRICPLCGLPVIPTEAEKRCSPLSGCAAWTTSAVYNKATCRWVQVGAA